MAWHRSTRTTGQHGVCAREQPLPNNAGTRRAAFTVAVVTLLPGGIEIDPQGEGMLAIAPLPSRVLDIPTRRKYRVRRGNWVSEPTAVGLNSARGCAGFAVRDMSQQGGVRDVHAETGTGMWRG